LSESGKLCELVFTLGNKHARRLDGGGLVSNQECRKTLSLMGLQLRLRQPTELAGAFLRARLEHSADVLALLGPALKQGTATLIAFTVVQKPEANPSFARTMLAGGIWTPDVWRCFVHHDLAFELGSAVRAWYWLGANGKVYLNWE
jgi:hypothetical protein